MSDYGGTLTLILITFLVHNFLATTAKYAPHVEGVLEMGFRAIIPDLPSVCNCSRSQESTPLTRLLGVAWSFHWSTCSSGFTFRAH